MMRSLVRLSVLPLMLVCAQLSMAQSTVTLYSPLKYKEKRQYCFVFKSGVIVEKLGRPCDLRYGALYAGEEWDSL